MLFKNLRKAIDLYEDAICDLIKIDPKHHLYQVVKSREELAYDEVREFLKHFFPPRDEEWIRDLLEFVIFSVPIDANWCKVNSWQLINQKS